MRGRSSLARMRACGVLARGGRPGRAGIPSRARPRWHRKAGPRASARAGHHLTVAGPGAPTAAAGEGPGNDAAPRGPPHAPRWRAGRSLAAASRRRAEGHRSVARRHHPASAAGPHMPGFGHGLLRAHHRPVRARSDHKAEERSEGWGMSAVNYRSGQLGQGQRLSVSEWLSSRSGLRAC